MPPAPWLLRLACNACRVRASVTPSDVSDTRRSYGSATDASRRATRTPERSTTRSAPLAPNRAGDQLVITELERLGRSAEHLIEFPKRLHARDVDLVVLDQGGSTPPRPADVCASRSSATWRC
ncbi:MAG: recombinase family protein [Solirubrobacteraceae bacterium]